MKIMKLLFSVNLIFWLVVGCSDYPTDAIWIEAQSWCSDFGGTKTVTFGEMSGLRTRCMDGKLIISK